MPELPVKEGRLPELRLPEISREEIIRSLSEIHRPEIDLSGVEWPKVDLSRIEWTREDLERSIVGLLTAVRIVRPAVRSRRLPLALGFFAAAGLATIAVLSRPSVRERLARTAREARRRAEVARGGPEMLDVDADVMPDVEHIAAVAIPIEPGAFEGPAEAMAGAEATEATESSSPAQVLQEASADLA